MKNIILLIFFVLKLNLTIATQANEHCKSLPSDFIYCVNSGSITSLYINGSPGKTLHINDPTIVNINLNAFKYLPIETLILDLSNQKINMEGMSWNALDSITRLDNIKNIHINTGSIEFKSGCFNTLSPSIIDLSIAIDLPNSNIKEALADLKNLKYFKITKTNFGRINKNTLYNKNNNILSLILENNNITSIEEYSFVSFGKLKTLEFIGQPLVNLKVGVFYGLDELDILTISWAKNLTVIENNVFHGLPKIKILEINNCNVRIIKSGAFNSKTMIYLSLRKNKLENIKIGLFDNVLSLESLNLRSNNLTFIPKAIFNCLTKLTTLDLSDNQIEKIDYGAFDGLRLSWLDLANNKLTVLNGGAFHGVTIHNINLSNNNIIFVPELIFANTKINSLYVSKCIIANKTNHELGLLSSAKIFLENQEMRFFSNV